MKTLLFTLTAGFTLFFNLKAEAYYPRTDCHAVAEIYNSHGYHCFQTFDPRVGFYYHCSGQGSTWDMGYFATGCHVIQVPN